MARLAAALLAWALLAPGLPGAAQAAEAREPEPQSWPHDGPFGTFDRASLQRGLQVYAEVCSSCHGLRLLSYRNLLDIGYSGDEAKAFAAQFEVQDGPNEAGEMFTRPARLSDGFVSPFANDNEARAVNNGALPPDLSLVVKTRAGACVLDLVVVCLAREGGEDYILALLTGYEEEPPGDWEPSEGMEYNPYFAGAEIAMPPPLSEDAVEYADGTPATVEQMSSDVAQFLAWAAEPTLEARKRLGFKVMAFLIGLSVLLFFVKRKVWTDVH